MIETKNVAEAIGKDFIVDNRSMSDVVKDLVQGVNDILKKNEPEDISVDTYSGYSGYSPQWVIDAMNNVVGIGNWGFKELSSEFVSKDEEGKPQLVIANVEVFIRGIEFRPTAYGQARITKGDFGDARKGAQTDAIKKALSYFSIGNRAYHGKLSNAQARK